MLVPDTIRKCVGFIGCRKANSDYVFLGTAFLLARDEPNNVQNVTMYFVTARHIIDGIRNLGLEETYLRLNLKDGTAKWVSIPLSNSSH